MLDNYDEIAFKAVTYPIIVALYKVADELSVLQSNEDNEKNCMLLVSWLETLDNLHRFAHQLIEDHVASLGVQVIDNPVPEEE